MIEQDEHIVLNGKLQKRFAADFALNRAFFYGDSLFESIKIMNGNPVFINAHFQRITEGMEVLKMGYNDRFNLMEINKGLSDLIHANEITQGGKANIYVFRNGERGYLPMDQKDTGFSFLLTASKTAHNQYILNQEGLSVDVYKEITKPLNKLSRYKTGNALIYIMASIYAKENGLGDCFLVNEKQSIIEGASSNLFLASSGVLYTPSLEEGCLAGTMRMQIINLALESGIKIYECSLKSQSLLIADEIFLTNAVHGIRWVGKYRANRYYHSIASKLLDKLNDKAIALTA